MNWNQVRKMNIQFIKNYKQALGCIECGTKNKLTFHHVNPSEKSFEVSRKCRSVSNNTLKREVEKCVVLCKYHHVKVHQRETK